jgi:polysaccharide export outer membrane protein
MKLMKGLGIVAAIAAFIAVPAASAQVTVRQGVPDGVKLPTPPPPAPPPAYVVGIGDVFGVVVLREKEISGDIVVRPDGKVSLPLGNDIVAIGLTVEQLREAITKELTRCCFTDPTVYVQVKAIVSRFVTIDGAVGKPGAYAVGGPMTISQLIALAGGLHEFADKKNIIVISATLKAKDGSPFTYKINYDDLMQGKNVAKNNIELRPGDQVIVRMK